MIVKTNRQLNSTKRPWPRWRKLEQNLSKFANGRRLLMEASRSCFSKFHDGFMAASGCQGTGLLWCGFLTKKAWRGRSNFYSTALNSRTALRVFYSLTEWGYIWVHVRVSSPRKSVCFCEITWERLYFLLISMCSLDR